MEMDEEIEPQKQKKEKKIRKQKKTRETEFGWSDVWNPIKKVLLVFLKVIWKIIKFILKYLLFPFWYTGVLFVKGFKFLRHRSKGMLTDEDRDFLSQIPALFLMFGLSVFLFYLLFYFDVIGQVEEITDPSFWQGVWSVIVDIAYGIYWLLQIIFVTFLVDMIGRPLSDYFKDHQWQGTLVLIAVIIVGTGLIILTYNMIKKGKLIIWFRKVKAKIKDTIKKTSQSIKAFVLKYIYGQKYIDTRSKNFFWTNFLLLTLVTIGLGIFAIFIIIQQSIVLENWDENAILRYAAILGTIIFAGIGVFSTWFFTLVNGVSSSPSTEQAEQ